RSGGQEPAPAAPAGSGAGAFGDGLPSDRGAGRQGADDVRRRRRPADRRGVSGRGADRPVGTLACAYRADPSGRGEHMSGPHQLKAIEIDNASLPAATAEIEHQRRVAVFDLVEQNSFIPDGAEGGPYT